MNKTCLGTFAHDKVWAEGILINKSQVINKSKLKWRRKINNKVLLNLNYAKQTYLIRFKICIVQKSARRQQEFNLQALHSWTDMTSTPCCEFALYLLTAKHWCLPSLSYDTGVFVTHAGLCLLQQSRNQQIKHQV